MRVHARGTALACTTVRRCCRLQASFLSQNQPASGVTVEGSFCGCGPGFWCDTTTQVRTQTPVHLPTSSTTAASAARCVSVCTAPTPLWANICSVSGPCALPARPCSSRSRFSNACFVATLMTGFPVLRAPAPTPLTGCAGRRWPWHVVHGDTTVSCPCCVCGRTPVRSLTAWPCSAPALSGGSAARLVRCLLSAPTVNYTPKR